MENEITMCESCAYSLLEDIKAGKYELNEAEYQGREVSLGKPFRPKGGPKKFAVYVKNDKGNVVKVNFGDPGLSIKRDSPTRKKAFRARHKCSQKKDRTSAGYWSCRMWSSKPVSKIAEASKTGGMTGTQEKEFSTGIRNIHMQYADVARDMITTRTPYSKINFGGCGIFAKLLYYNMRKYLGVTPEFIVFDFHHAKSLPKGDINKYSDVHDFYRQGHNLLHVVCKVGDYYIDSSGIHKKEWFERAYRKPLKEYEGLTIQTLTKWVNTSEAWNPTFNRYDIGNINKDMVNVMKAVQAAGIVKK